MRTLFRFMLVLGLLSSSHSLWGMSTAEVFKTVYSEHYQERRCRDNVKFFFELLKQNNISLQGFYLVEMTNEGLSFFNLLNVEKARGQLRGQPAEVEANWYYHAVAINQEGFVYDFDYSTTPQILKLNDYLEQMFLQENECPGGTFGEFCVGREEKLKRYEMKWFVASDLMESRNVKPSHVTTFREALAN